MEDDEKKPVTQTEDNTEGTGTQPEEKNEGNKDVKTFTQEEVNAMLTKERKKAPSKEELKAFNEWKESQKTAEQKQQETVLEAERLKQENNAKDQILEIMKKGVDYDKAEFIQYKLSKMDGDFSDNLEGYLKTNSVVGNGEGKKPNTTGFSQQGGITSKTNEKDYLDKKYANNPYYKK